jgi:hypothetical protein
MSDEFVVKRGTDRYLAWERLNIYGGVSSRSLGHGLPSQNDLLRRGADRCHQLPGLLAVLENLPNWQRETRNLLEVQDNFQANVCRTNEPWYKDKFVVTDKFRMRWRRLKGTQSLLLLIELRTVFALKDSMGVAAETVCRIWTNIDFGPWMLEKEPPLESYLEVPEGEILFTPGHQLSDSTRTGSFAYSNNVNTRTLSDAIMSLSRDYGITVAGLSDFTRILAKTAPSSDTGR